MMYHQHDNTPVWGTPLKTKKKTKEFQNVGHDRC